MNRHIPQGSAELVFNDVNAVVYTRELAGAYYAMGYSGKRGKNDFHYKFKTTDAMQTYIGQYIDKLKEVQTYKETVKQEKKIQRANFKHNLKVGDILYTSWGYEQTNIDFYQVTEIVGKNSIKLRQIDSKDVGNNQGHSMSATCVAVKDSFKPNEKEILKRVSPSYRNEPYVNLSSFESAYVWDGQPKNYSWYG